MDAYYAHSIEGNPDKSAWQLLEEHLRQTAELARKFASEMNAGEWGYLAGLWHDIGKYSSDFQRKINSAGGENAHIESGGRVDHSTAGAQHANRTIKDIGYGKALAYVIAGHHGGLLDGISPDSCLQKRLEKEIPDYSNCHESMLLPDKLSSPLTLPFTPDASSAGIQFSLFIRMLYSCLVDADFLDTEAFLQPQKSQQRQSLRSLKDIESFFFKELKKIRVKPCQLNIKAQREFVLGQCLGAAEKEMGLFSLTVPTGGGKTLSSMAFALRHALKHGLRRIIYVIPFTSIIEQNAEVFRSVLGDDCVLEHHCNFDPEKEDYRSRLASENWDAPIIVTTNVQFFESLFANQSNRCRKLHNIMNSVVILDEVQALPAEYLLPCLETLKELVATYKVSVVLCSATQPAIHHRPDFKRGLEGVIEIIKNPQELAQNLKRIDVKMIAKITNVVLAGQIQKYDQVLCVVNTRRHAQELYRRAQSKDGLYHLSALMCPVHRSLKLDEVRDRLKNGLLCRVVSTQLVEAGVDIDFPVVFRSLAGIDSIAQAAGRCNREGRMEKGEVFVFIPEDGLPSGHFRQTAQTAESVIRGFPDDILSLQAIEDYFRNYYWLKGDRLDTKGILGKLQGGIQKGDFPFKTIAEEFRLIDDNSKPVVIPFNDDARLLINKLDHIEYPLALSRKLQKYSVSIYPHEYNELFSAGSIDIKGGLFPVLIDESLYDDNLGLLTENPMDRSPKSLVI